MAPALVLANKRFSPLTTTQSAFLEMLDSAHQSNKLHTVSSLAPHDIVSPAADSGGSHHFVSATDAAQCGSNFKRLLRPLNVDTANGPTKVYYMCDIPTALGILRGYILPGALHSLASVALLCKQLDLTYSQGATGAVLFHSSSNTVVNLRGDGGLYFLPSTRQAFTEQHLQAHVVRTTQGSTTYRRYDTLPLGQASISGQTDSEGSHGAWQLAPPSYVFGAHTG